MRRIVICVIGFAIGYAGSLAEPLPGDSGQKTDSRKIPVLSRVKATARELRTPTKPKVKQDDRKRHDEERNR